MFSFDNKTVLQNDLLRTHLCGNIVAHITRHIEYTVQINIPLKFARRSLFAFNV